jgi:Spy/CpxP family protein refolding chaperone
MAGQRGGHDRMMKDLDLTADQQARIKAIHAKYAAQLKSARDASRPNLDAMKKARASGDTAAMRAAREKMRADMRANMAPVQKVRQQEMAEIRAVLTPDQQQKFDAQQAKMKARMDSMGVRGQKGRGAWMGKRPAKAGQPAQPVKPAQPIN